MAKKIQIIIGSTRQGRVGPSVAAWVAKHAVSQTGIEVEVIDLKEENLPWFNSPVPPMYAADTSPEGVAWGAKIGSADGYILVTSEYNHGYPAPLKNAIDYLHKEWNEKPAMVVSYGYANKGLNASRHLHDVLTILKMVTLKNTVAIALTQDIVGETGALKDADTDLKQYEADLQTALDELTAAVNSA